MIGSKKKVCVKCAEEGNENLQVLVNSHFSLCFRHNEARLDAHRERRSPISKKSKPSGEKNLFLALWQVRAHICEHCGVFLGNEPEVSFFSHIKPKSTYPELRLTPSNIKLSCFFCHYTETNMSKEKYDSLKQQPNVLSEQHTD